MNNKVVFYLMTEKGAEVLQSFIDTFESGRVHFVIVSKDTSMKNDFYYEIEQICKKNNIMFYDKSDNIPEHSYYIFAIGWRWIIKDSEKVIVLHDSVLPKYRGFAPLVNCLINGDKELGVTALFASDKYDCGDIIAQQKLGVEYPIKIHDAIKKVSKIYAELVISICKDIFSNKTIIGKCQDEIEATYSLWRDKEDYFINWKKDSEYIKRFIDSLGYPFDGAKTLLNGRQITVFDAVLVKDVAVENRDVGKVIFIEDGCPIIVCGQGLIKILRAAYSDSNEDILPIKQFRSRFG